MKTIIEVGANNGGHTGVFLQDGNSKVYCFEPTVELQIILLEKFKNNDNFYLIPAAVDLVNDFKYFNIAGTSDWGCSSLHNFSDDIEEKWPNRPDFQITDRYRVITMRLDTFFEIFKITQVDYIHIDAQGNDFNVLKSLGHKIHCVAEGRCEASHDVKLYKNVNNKSSDIVKWLEAKGFECTFENPHQEVDILFKRK